MGLHQRIQRLQKRCYKLHVAAIQVQGLQRDILKEQIKILKQWIDDLKFYEAFKN